MNKMRISITEKNGELRGIIASEGDAVFVLECLLLIVNEISKKSGIPNNEIIQDLYSLANKEHQ